MKLRTRIVLGLVAGGAAGVTANTVAAGHRYHSRCGPVRDMCRTPLDVTGDLTAALCVERAERVADPELGVGTTGPVND